MRKQPKQARSREMVERILAAGRAVLVHDGYDAFSTNRVADAAGVSPGSLYQYFPDKAAIIDVIVDNYWDDVADRVVASLGDRIGEVGLPMVRGVVDALLAALESDPTLLRLIDEELPRRRFRDRRRALERRVVELLVATLAVWAPGLPRDEAHRSAWVIVQTMEGLAVRWVVDRPDLAREDLVEELVAVATGYLAARGTTAFPTPAGPALGTVGAAPDGT